MRVGTVIRLWRYPVKSMAGERMSSADFSWRGIPGDRGWAVYDETRKGITGAKRLPPLRGCGARYAQEPVAGSASPPAEITLADGSTFRSDSEDSPGDSATRSGDRFRSARSARRAARRTRGSHRQMSRRKRSAP